MIMEAAVATANPARVTGNTAVTKMVRKGLQGTRVLAKVEAVTAGTAIRATRTPPAKQMRLRSRNSLRRRLRSHQPSQRRKRLGAIGAALTAPTRSPELRRKAPAQRP